MPQGVTGYFDISGDKDFTLRVSYSEQYDIEKNTSVLSLTKLQVRSASGGWGYYGWQYYPDGTIKVAGQTAMEAESALPTHEVGIQSTDNWYDVTGPYKAVTIEHNNDGSKAVSISVSLRWYVPGGGGGSGWATVQSKTIQLTTIPRASAIVAKASSIGSPLTIQLQRASASFTHTVTLSLGNYSQTVENVAESVEITTDMEWCNALPNAVSGTAAIQCITYSGKTEIGRKTATVTLSVPASVRPKVRNLGSGIDLFEDLFLQGRSSIKITVEASGAYGSTVKSITTQGAGYSKQGQEVTLGPLNLSGDVVFTTTVTDSRGRQSTDTVRRTVIAYRKPEISVQACYRARPDGTADPAGESLWVRATFTCAPVNGKNAISGSAAYAEGREGYFQGEEAILSGTGSVVFAGKISAKNAYTIQFKAVDAVGETAETTADITSSTNYLITAMRRYAALCGYVDGSKTPGLQVYGDIHGDCDLFLSGLSVGQHLLVDSCGENWIRFMNGAQICWGSFKGLPNGQTTNQTGEQWGQMFHCDYYPEKTDFPVPFRYRPHIGIFGSDEGTNALISRIKRTNSDITDFKVIRPENTFAPQQFSYFAGGTWAGNPWQPETPEEESEDYQPW